MGRNCFSCGTGAPCCVCPTTARRRTFFFPHFSLSLAVANVFHMWMHLKNLNLNHTILLVRGLCIAVGFFFSRTRFFNFRYYQSNNEIILNFKKL